MCQIRIHIHPKSGCNLIKLILTYCAVCPYVSKRPLLSSPDQNIPSTSSDYQIYYFSHYLDASHSKKHKKWRSRLSKCPNWGGAKYVENLGAGSECPAGSLCQRDRDRRVRLVFDGRVRKNKKGGEQGDGEDLMDEMARLESEFDCEGEKEKERGIKRDEGLARLVRDEGEMERVFEGVRGVLAGLERFSRERGDGRKTWWVDDSSN
jgi:hypothetical protein